MVRWTLGVVFARAGVLGLLREAGLLARRPLLARLAVLGVRVGSVGLGIVAEGFPPVPEVGAWADVPGVRWAS